MTIILVDQGNKERDLQLANRVWNCVVSNVERGRVFEPKVTELLYIGTVGKLDKPQSIKFAKYLEKHMLTDISDDQVIFEDGRIGEVTITGQGFGMDTPYHLLSHVSKQTLQELFEFASECHGFHVC